MITKLASYKCMVLVRDVNQARQCLHRVSAAARKMMAMSFVLFTMRFLKPANVR